MAIALNLRESEATKLYREYWKLKQLHNLNMVYEDIKDNIESFIELYKLAKAKSIDVEQIVNLLKIANNDLLSIEERFKRLRNDVSMLAIPKIYMQEKLYQLNNQIATTSRLLTSLRISCERERRDFRNVIN